MIKTYKVMLLPNNKQRTRLFQCAGVARWAYNWALVREQENYKQGNKFISSFSLIKELTQLKKQGKYTWLGSVACDISRQAVIDACGAYEKFFKKKSKFPKFKSKKKSKPSFYQRGDVLTFTKTHVCLTKLASSTKKNKAMLNWVKLAEKDFIPLDVKYINPRVTFDGLHWWISVGVEYKDNRSIPSGEGIGIDLGIKDLAICSDGSIYRNTNKSTRVKKLEKRKRRLQRQVSLKYKMNKQGKKYVKTKNIVKKELELKRLQAKLNGIRTNHLHQTSSDIIKRKPSFIVLEDLNVSGMLKNKHLAKSIQQQSFYEFRRQIKYKSEWNNIQVIFADRFYPSSKTCSECGSIKKDLKLSDRVYKCSICGNVIDRDLNAAINLRNYKTS